MTASNILNQMTAIFDAAECKMADQERKFALAVQKSATDAQIAALAKLMKFGWFANKLYYSKTTDKIALVIQAADNVGYVYPDGRVERAEVGAHRVVLNQNF